jgi:hypothetical protein
MRRSAIVLAALLAAATALPSHAAPKPQISDPKGDDVGMQAGTDIVSVTWSTTGTGSGRKYVPKKLVVTMTLAGPAISEPGLTYEVQAETGPCGVVGFTAEQGSPYSVATGLNGWADFGSCLDPTGNAVELLTIKTQGNDIVWSWSIKQLPKELKLGTAFTSFEARVDPTNPVIPFPSNATATTLGLIDKGTGAGPWKLG